MDSGNYFRRFRIFDITPRGLPASRDFFSANKKPASTTSHAGHIFTIDFAKAGARFRARRLIHNHIIGERSQIEK
jgi:hypothetical protein